ncbi:unnamed protein product, partial [Ectocarpus fasciculatus]
MRIERRAAPTKDGRVVEFQEPFVADLSHAVSAFGVDLWLDGSCLRGHVRDVFKTTVEAVLDTEMNEHYPDLLPNGPNPAAGPSPVAATSVAARCPILALPPSRATGAGASKALGAPEAVVKAGSARNPLEVALD